MPAGSCSSPQGGSAHAAGRGYGTGAGVTWEQLPEQESLFGLGFLKAGGDGGCGREMGRRTDGGMKARPRKQQPAILKVSLLVLGAAQLSDRAIRKLNEGIRKKQSWVLAEKGTSAVCLLPGLCWELPSSTCLPLELTSLR